jgi:hypothetical protein
MKLQCMSRELSEEQRTFFKAPSRSNPKHRVTVGKEYLVIGISFVVDSPYYGDSALFEVVNDDRHLVLLPGALFEITDARCSSFWRAKIHSDGMVTLRPKELYREYFHDDLSDREPETQKVFQALLLTMEAEFAVETPLPVGSQQ